MSALLKIPDVALRLQISESAVRELIRLGQLVSCRVGPRGGSIRVREDDLLSYVASTRRRNQPVQDRPSARHPASELARKYFPKLYGQPRS